MTDTVTVRTLFDDTDNTIVRLLGSSDGTGEVSVNKVNIATIKKNRNGNQPNGLRIEQIRWAIQGYGAVQLVWDRTATPQTADFLTNSGYDDLRGLLRGANNMARIGGDQDPNENAGDGKGSILLSSIGAVAGGTYDITLWLAKSQN